MRILLVLLTIFFAETTLAMPELSSKIPPSASDQWKFQNMQRLVDRYAKKYGIDRERWHKLIELESQWDRFAVSKKHASGLCQIWPPTAKAYGMRGNRRSIILQLHNPKVNIPLCARILHDLLHRYDGDWFNVAIAFNAGPKVVSYALKISKAGSRVAKN